MEPRLGDLIGKTADDYHVRLEDYQERGGYDNKIDVIFAGECTRKGTTQCCPR